ERNRQSAERAAGQRDCKREMKSSNVPAKGLRQRFEKPLQREKPPLFLPRFVNFAVGAGDEIFQIAPRLRLGRERRDPGEVGGGAFVKLMEQLQLRERQLQIRLGFHPVEQLFQLVPERTAVGDETMQINDHSNCLCLTLKYCDTSSALKRSLPSSEN